jgi:acetyl-CoA carboxylase biotin carboxyl carrier protein
MPIAEPESVNMSKAEVPLSEDEVRQISRIIDTLNHSTFDYLQLEFGTLKLTIGKGAQVGVPSSAPSGAPSGAPAPAPVAEPAAVAAAAPSASAPAAAALPAASADVPLAAGEVAITASMIGRFYSQPEPGAAAYVSVGATVREDSTVGLVEAMKMFNAVHAGVNGVITRICVQDAALVEYGQVLFHVRPS